MEKIPRAKNPEYGLQDFGDFSLDILEIYF